MKRSILLISLLVLIFLVSCATPQEQLHAEENGTEVNPEVGQSFSVTTNNNQTGTFTITDIRDKSYPGIAGNLVLDTPSGWVLENIDLTGSSTGSMHPNYQVKWRDDTGTLYVWVFWKVASIDVNFYHYTCCLIQSVSTAK